MNTRIGLSVLAALATLSPATAATTVYTSRAAFNAAAAAQGTIVTEGYESYANDFTIGALTITLSVFTHKSAI